MGNFEDSWRDFANKRRLEFGSHTDPDFRDGHDVSASFVVPVASPDILRRLSVFREALSPFGFVTLHPDHFLHISLAFAGFISESPDDGGISPSRLGEIAALAREALAGVEPFRVRLANLNAFPGVAYVEVHDDTGGLDTVAGLLSRKCGLKAHESKSGKSHVTIAYFEVPDGTEAPEELIEAISEYRDWPLGDVEVGRVDLTLLELREEYPKLGVVEEIRLGGSA